MMMMIKFSKPTILYALIKFAFVADIQKIA